MSVQLTIDSRKFRQALKKYPDAVHKALRVGMKEEIQETIRLARRKRMHPEWTTRSGALERSMISMVTDDGLFGIIQLSKTVSSAPYAVRMHEGGQGKKDSLGRPMNNKPSPFLYRAFEKRKNRIIRGLNDAVKNAIEIAGLN